jgi:hypothetical protein
MKSNTQENRALAAAQTFARVDLYTGIHKGLRAMMADTLVAVGRMDPSDTAELTSVTGRVLELLDFCAMHIAHENSFVHVAIEANASGGSEVVAREHRKHLQHIETIKTAVAALWSTPDTRDISIEVLVLYRDLALFVAENFQHMHGEETTLNAMLWARYTDSELVEIHNNLLASILPSDMMFILRWMVPYLNPAERVAMLADIRAHAPVGVFVAAMKVVQPHLTSTEWTKLTQSIGAAQVSGLSQI